MIHASDRSDCTLTDPRLTELSSPSGGLGRETVAGVLDQVEGSVTNEPTSCESAMQLSDWIGELASEAAEVGGQGDRVLDGAEETDAALSRVSNLVGQSHTSRTMLRGDGSVEGAVAAFGPTFEAMEDSSGGDGRGHRGFAEMPMR